MTALNEALKHKICTYCAMNRGGCLACVPWYAVSFYCSHFREPELQRAPVVRRGPSMERIIKRSLVDTF